MIFPSRPHNLIFSPTDLITSPLGNFLHSCSLYWFLYHPISSGSLLPTFNQSFFLVIDFQNKLIDNVELMMCDVVEMLLALYRPIPIFWFYMWNSNGESGKPKVVLSLNGEACRLFTPGWILKSQEKSPRFFKKSTIFYLEILAGADVAILFAAAEHEREASQQLRRLSFHRQQGHATTSFRLDS